MKTIFSSLYQRVMSWSRHPRAVPILGGLSFIESSFFPIPPDVMLAPMSLARPDRAYYFALVTTIASVLGGLLGYAIGLYGFHLIEEWLLASKYAGAFATAQQWFGEYGFLAIFVAGFSPIPYKVFTIAAGVVGMPLLPFILASIVGRGGRFFLVAGLMRWGGARLEGLLETYVNRIGWATVALVVLGVGLNWIFGRSSA